MLPVALAILLEDVLRKAATIWEASSSHLLLSLAAVEQRRPVSGV